MTDNDINNVQTLGKIEEIFFINRLHEIPIPKLLDWYRMCIHESTATPQGDIASHRYKATRLAEAIAFELNAKITVGTQNLIQSQVNQTAALINVSESHKNQTESLIKVSNSQLDMAKALVEEAKASGKLNKTLVALTWVIAIYTAVLAIPVIGDLLKGIFHLLCLIVGYSDKT